MSDNLMRVQPIRNGTVIDHIKAGRGRKVLDALELIDKGTTITLLMHVPSKKNSSKDVIKIEDRELSESESQKLALLSPGAHVNIIRNFVVAEKNIAELPKSISDICKFISASNNQAANSLNDFNANLYKLLFVESNPIPVKWMLNKMGRIQPGIRLPLVPFNQVFHEKTINEITISNPKLFIRIILIL